MARGDDLVVGRQRRQLADGRVEDRRVGVGDEQPVRLSVRSALEAASGRRFGIRDDAERAQSRPVQQPAAVEMEDEDRRVGRGGVQLFDRRHASLRELCRRPASDDAHPLALGSARRLFPHHLERGGQRIDAIPAQLERIEPSTAGGVQVRIVQPRDQRAPSGVQDPRLRPAEPRHLLVGADGHEAPAAHGQRGRAGLRRIERDHARMRHNQVRGLRGRLSAGARREQRRCQGETEVPSRQARMLLRSHFGPPFWFRDRPGGAVDPPWSGAVRV